jgi:hypothetical protein
MANIVGRNKTLDINWLAKMDYGSSSLSNSI